MYKEKHIRINSFFYKFLTEVIQFHEVYKYYYQLLLQEMFTTSKITIVNLNDSFAWSDLSSKYNVNKDIFSSMHELYKYSERTIITSQDEYKLIPMIIKVGTVAEKCTNCNNRELDICKVQNTTYTF